VSGIVGAAVRSGLIARLAREPATLAELVTDLGIHPTPADLLLNCLVAGGYLRRRGERYSLSRRARRWLDPASPTSVAHFVAATSDYWAWWSDLSNTLSTAQPAAYHDLPATDPYWRRYILGQRDLARLCAPEVGRKIAVPSSARSVLDVGGGHGWYSSDLCRRHPSLSATVIDLPGSVAVGRELVQEAGMADRVSFVTGDVTSADLGGPYDLALCFNVVHHLGPDRVLSLLTRIRDALVPGGSLSIMDGFIASGRRASMVAANAFGLFAYVSSGSRAFTVDQLGAWLSEAGLEFGGVTPVRRIPGLAIYKAVRPKG
jgi:2-polyprenyl-3-methyl-5-hydroxy-6-metoxy-1,4-benzoquinol methylase